MTALRAPAKINLGLRVTGRRSDGYHTLDSLFLPLDLVDEIELDVAEGGRLDVRLSVEPASRADTLGPPEANLAVRAARAFLEAAGRAASVRLRLHKRIPVAAGLGGGSSDAGAVLRGLAERWPGTLAPARLTELALGLGADVPYFLDPRPARVTGIGERIERLAASPTLWLLLATPRPGLSTARVFAEYARGDGALTPGDPGRTMPGLPAFGACGGPHGIDALEPRLLEALLRNDLEPAATRLRPEIARLRRALEEAGARATGMSGSGPTMYGVFEDAAAARRAGTRLEALRAGADRTELDLTVARTAGID